MLESEGFVGFQAELERLEQALREFPRTARTELRDVVTQALMLLASHAARYPDKPPGSRYRRTGTLGRTWVAARPHITVAGHLLAGRISNATPYGPLVMGPGEQLEIHRGRWRTTDQIVAEHGREVEPLLAQAGLAMVERIAAVV